VALVIPILVHERLEMEKIVAQPFRVTAILFHEKGRMLRETRVISQAELIHLGVFPENHEAADRRG
jgi:hypothetical protein